MGTSNPRSICSPIHSLLILAIFGCVITLGFKTLFWSPIPFHHHLDGLAIVWAGYFGVLLLCKNAGLCKSLFVNDSIELSICFWMIVLGLGILFRSQVLLAEPYFADDYQRYLFDGRLILSGINPYAVTPMTFPELGGTSIPKPDIKTIYPPLAEGLFAVASWLGGTLWHWRVLNLIPDLLGAIIFFRLLKANNLPESWIVLWLWNPLILKEGLHAAHLDIWTLFAVLLFIYWAQQKHLRIAAFSLGAAVLLKLIPLLLLPAWLTQLSSRRERLMVVGLVSGIIIVGFSWFLPWHPFGNLTVFLQHIQGYGVFFQVFQHGFGALDLDKTGILDAEWSKWLLISLGGALYLHWVFILRRYSSQSPLRLLELFLLLYVFSSMGFPWYLLPALPWVLIHGHWFWMLFIALSQLVFYAGQLHTESTVLTGTTLLVLLLAACQQSGSLKVSTEGEK